jgi:hypothetical protein
MVIKSDPIPSKCIKGNLVNLASHDNLSFSAIKLPTERRLVLSWFHHVQTSTEQPITIPRNLNLHQLLKIPSRCLMGCLVQRH